MGKRREYTKAFKESAVDLVVSSGRKLKDVAGELGISPENLMLWSRGGGAEIGRPGAYRADAGGRITGPQAAEVCGRHGLGARA
jgi:transposase-like protein